MATQENQRHFVLVHGLCHGGWCWYRLTTLLRDAGLRVSPIDLGASGINPLQLEDIHSMTDYNQPLYSFMEALPASERVILVGHSMGGLAISPTMERFPEKVAVGVYLSAYMTGVGFNIVDINQRFPVTPATFGDSEVTVDAHGRITSVLAGPNFLATTLYPLSPPEDLNLVYSLGRPFPFYNDERSIKETILTEERFGTVSRVYILLSNDAVIPADIARWMIEQNPPNEVKVIDNSDHMAMDSKTQELFSHMQEIAATYF